MHGNPAEQSETGSATPRLCMRDRMYVHRGAARVCALADRTCRCVPVRACTFRGNRCIGLEYGRKLLIFIYPRSRRAPCSTKARESSTPVRLARPARPAFEGEDNGPGSVSLRVGAIRVEIDEPRK